MRPVTSQVAAEIGYDPAGGTDPGPFTQQVAERLHAADPRWGRRINSTGPISDDTVAYRVGTSPVNPLSIDIVLAAHTTHARLQWHTYDHWAETPGGHPTISHYIPAYPGISRYIPAYLGSFFLFAGTKAAALAVLSGAAVGRDPCAGPLPGPGRPHAPSGPPAYAAAYPRTPAEPGAPTPQIAALVHNSRSRSIIALHPEIRGPA